MDTRAFINVHEIAPLKTSIEAQMVIKQSLSLYKEGFYL